jgi:hypothetical protein
LKIKKLALPVMSFLVLSGILMITVAANAWPSLPSTQVQLTVVNGTNSYFISTLSGVPGGFDVNNGTYTGWCVDRSVNMTRGVPHNVLLYSSLSPPMALNKIDWIAIDYILNHKQGTMMDIQQAIWHFSDAFSPISTIAQEMVDAANANPAYDPTSGGVLAIICAKQNDSNAQNSIIELTRSHEVIVTNVTAPPWTYQDIPVIPHECANISVTVENVGDFPEDAWVYLYYNITADLLISSIPVQLDVGQNFTHTFVWVTIGIPPRTYTLTAVATIPTGSDVYTDGNITVRLKGDVNGDGIVDLKDVALVASAFGSTPNSPNWNPAADLNGDGTVNMEDMALIARYFGRQTTY